MHIDATSIFDDVSHDDDYLDVIVLPEITKMSLSQSVQVIFFLDMVTAQKYSFALFMTGSSYRFQNGDDIR